ncbi:MAG: hypothetical protein ABI670_17010 [Chloroflexota bacterium]
MDIRADNGSSLHLEIVGYEFPDMDNVAWDSNWLRIHMSVTLPEGAWSITHPFLLTQEVKDLADWFDAVDAHVQAEKEIGFVEPNLSFDVIYGANKESYLRVHFAAECLPPWARKSEYGTEDVFADLPLSEIDLHAAADSLRHQLSIYPQRTPY